LGQLAAAGIKRIGPVLMPAIAAVGVAAAVVLLAPAWTQIRTYDDVDATWIERQRAAEKTDGADFASLVAMVAATNDRVFAGGRSDWGAGYTIGDVPGVIELTNLDVNGVGFTGRVPALTEPSEGRFDDTNPAHFELFDVRYEIEPADHAPPP